MYEIKTIAECRYGTAISPGDYDNTGRVWVIDATAVTTEGLLRLGKRTTMAKRFMRHLLKRGDILLRGRTSNSFNAAVFEGDDMTPEEQAIATASVIVLRLKDGRIQPAFLVWLLNQPPTQAALKNAQQGAITRLISTAAVGKIRIPIPAHEAQMRALQLNELTARYQKIVTLHCEAMKKLTLEKIWKT